MVDSLDYICDRLTMDALAGLLDGPRARGAFVLRVVMSPPWSITVEDEAPLTVMVVTRGSAVLTGSSGPVAAGGR